MKILLTGAAGFTGSHVLPLLGEKGSEVICLVRSIQAAECLRAVGVSCIVGDLSDSRLLRDALAGKDALINIASLGFGHARGVVEAAELAGIKRALFVSTTAIFTSINAPSKRARLEAEETIRTSRLNWTILRPTMIYGTQRDRNICRLIRMIRRYPAVPVLGSGEFMMQPVHVGDVADAIVKAVLSECTVGRAYAISGKEPLSFNELINTTAACLKKKTRLVHLPSKPMIRALQFTEHMGLKLPLKAEQIQRLNEHKAFDWTEAAVAFGYSPRSFLEGVLQEIQEMGLGPTCN